MIRLTITGNTTGEGAAREIPLAVADAGVALLDLSLHVVAIDPGAASILSAISGDSGRWPRGPEPGITIPPILLQHLSASTRSGACPGEVRFTVGSHIYVARCYMVEASDGALPESCMVLHLEREAEISDACLELSRRYHLTEREEEALRGVASGLTSKEVAQRMNISPSTVKTFLRLIMIKTGSSNRAGIVAKLFASRSAADEPSRNSSLAAGRRSDALNWPE
jgi:DNA-binding CsgD family transcriptional regulator